MHLVRLHVVEHRLHLLCMLDCISLYPQWKSQSSHIIRSWGSIRKGCMIWLIIWLIMRGIIMVIIITMSLPRPAASSSLLPCWSHQILDNCDRLRNHTLAVKK